MISNLSLKSIINRRNLVIQVTLACLVRSFLCHPLAGPVDTAYSYIGRLLEVAAGRFCFLSEVLRFALYSVWPTQSNILSHDDLGRKMQVSAVFISVYIVRGNRGMP